MYPMLWEARRITKDQLVDMLMPMGWNDTLKGKRKEYDKRRADYNQWHPDDRRRGLRCGDDSKGRLLSEEWKHYILYEEMMEGFTGKVKNVIKISPSGMDIIKKGIANTHMQFEKNKKNLSCYTTPLGDMVVGIQANRIKINEEPDSLLVNVDYSLDINYEHLSDCSIRLDVQSCPQ